jgi:hypothetical protein
VGYPPLSVLGNMAATLDFEHIRSRKNIDGEIPRHFLRNQMHFDNQEVHSVKDPNHRQTVMAGWTQDAFRWAYPYGRMSGYPNTMPQDVERAIVRGREMSPVTADELQAWCTVINAADNIPLLYA